MMNTQFGKTKTDMSPGRWLDHIQSIWPAILSGNLREYEMQSVLSEAEYKDVGQYRFPMLENAYRKADETVQKENFGRCGILLCGDTPKSLTGLAENICQANAWSFCMTSRSKAKHPLYQYRGEDVLIINEPFPDRIPLQELVQILTPTASYAIKDTKITRTLGFCKAVFVLSADKIEQIQNRYRKESETLVRALPPLLPYQAVVMSHNKSPTGKIAGIYEWNESENHYHLLQARVYQEKEKLERGDAYEKD